MKKTTKNISKNHALPVSNQEESEVGSAAGFDWIEDRDMQTNPDQCQTVDYIVRHEAVQKMREGPSESACRS